MDENRENVEFEPAGKTGWGKKSVTRRFLITALAITVIANAAVSAGALSLISKSSKPSRHEKSVTEDQRNSPSDNGFGDRYFDQYGDQYNDGYGNQYNDGYGDQYFDPYGGRYDNGYSDNGQEQSSRASIGIVISENSGVYVTQVTGNNAKKAGFAEGDKIVSVDGKTIGSSSDLISEVQSHKSGDTITVVVERNGQSIELKTVLE